ncbi:YegP family protein [Massilia sp.]|uniref:YegP family protein n=1 Tax=Massilia sp. TaxID=1882437 RepID=UPI00289822ED|nr:YegP family protein [Massilia sp.]
MPGYYVLQKNPAATQYYDFVLRADNHEIILTSENYVSKQGAQAGIASCQANSPYDSRYERLTSISSQPYFVLKALNGQPIGVSEMYSSYTARDNGITSCKTNGPTTRIIDLV